MNAAIDNAGNIPEPVAGVWNDGNAGNEAALSQLSIEEYMPSNIPLGSPEKKRAYYTERIFEGNSL